MNKEDLELAKSYVQEWSEKIRGGLKFDQNDWEGFMRDTDRAKKIIDGILKEDPNNQEAKIELARWHLCQSLNEGRFKDGVNKAIKHMEKVVEIAPDSANYRCGLGLLYSRAGKKKLAIEQLERSVELEPNNMEFKKELDRVKAEGGGCFIASAVFESPHSFEVEILRNFRDKTLLVSLYGKLFVKSYYFFSPPIASFISDKKVLKNFLKYYFFTPLIKYLSNRKG
jgi:tetratricopeptide (TPR) repeat protein